MNKPYLFRTYTNAHKSYDVQLERNPSPAHDIPIWQVARATCAAPAYFKPAAIDGQEYLDGGFGTNNPCAETFYEVKNMNNDYEKCVYLVLSVGTGKTMQLTRFQGRGIRRYLNYAEFARRYATDCEQVDKQMRYERGPPPGKSNNYRLNVEEGLERMKLDDWRASGPVKRKIVSIIVKSRTRPSKAVSQQIETSVGNEAQPQNGQVSSDIRSVQNGNHSPENARNDSGMEGPTELNSAPVITENGVGGAGPMSVAPSQRRSSPMDLTAIPRWLQPRNKTLEDIRKYTMAYLEEAEVEEWLEQCAETLVENRRDRAKSDPERWEKTCFGIRYECIVNGCPKADQKHLKREDMRKHLSRQHENIFGPEDEERERILDRCKNTDH